ncbi:hypothetical protein KTR9_2873 [Gordonia sp. KTR9]|nr:hypothetical protein KTR9_2873 [Gordonia sp. KTR9]
MPAPTGTTMATGMGSGSSRAAMTRATISTTATSSAGARRARRVSAASMPAPGTLAACPSNAPTTTAPTQKTPITTHPTAVATTPVGAIGVGLSRARNIIWVCPFGSGSTCVQCCRAV